MRHLLPLLLALACPSLAQTAVSAGRVETVYASGPRVARSGLAKGAGTSGTGAAMSDPTGVVGLWDLGNTSALIKGGYLLNGSTQYLNNVLAAPCTNGSSTILYPLTVVIYFRLTATTADSTLFSLDGGAGPQLTCYVDSTNYLACYADSTAAEAKTTTSVTDSRWHTGILVFASASARFAYLDTDTTGGTETTTVNTTAESTFIGTGAGGGPCTGSIAYTACLPVDLSGAGAAARRTAIFAGADPVLVAGFTLGNLTRSSDGATGAVWLLDNDGGVDSGPGSTYDLTPQAAPTAQNNLLVARDLSGGGYHMRAGGTGGAPTWSATYNNSQGGADFDGTANYLSGSPPATDTPFAFYIVGNSDVTTGGADTAVGLVASGDTYCVLQWPGGTNARQRTSQGANGVADAASDYTADVDYLVWAYFGAATGTCGIERNGAAGASDATSTNVASLNTAAIGSYRGSSPGQFFNGQLGPVLMLNTDGTNDQPRIERFFSTAYALGF